MVIQLDSGSWLGAGSTLHATPAEAHRSLRDRLQHLEGEVTTLLASAPGATVVQQASVGGLKLDALVSGHPGVSEGLKTAVEIKGTSVSPEAAERFASTVSKLRAEGHVASGLIVSTEPLKRRVRAIIKNNGLLFETVEGLRRQVAATSPQAHPVEPRQPEQRPKYAFVVMPFDESFDDVFFYGIRGAVQKAEMTCRRADEIPHNDMIMTVVEEEIARSDVVIADLTNANPNVFFEAGIAYALRKPLVTLVQDLAKIPVDLVGRNHLVYSGKIKVLETKLLERLRGLLAGPK